MTLNSILALCLLAVQTYFTVNCAESAAQSPGEVIATISSELFISIHEKSFQDLQRHLQEAIVACRRQHFTTYSKAAGNELENGSKYIVSFLSRYQFNYSYEAVNKEIRGSWNRAVLLLLKLYHAFEKPDENRLADISPFLSVFLIKGTAQQFNLDHILAWIDQCFVYYSNDYLSRDLDAEIRKESLALPAFFVYLAGKLVGQHDKIFNMQSIGDSRRYLLEGIEQSRDLEAEPLSYALVHTVCLMSQFMPDTHCFQLTNHLHSTAVINTLPPAFRCKLQVFLKVAPSSMEEDSFWPLILSIDHQMLFVPQVLQPFSESAFIMLPVAHGSRHQVITMSPTTDYKFYLPRAREYQRTLQPVTGYLNHYDLLVISKHAAIHSATEMEDFLAKAYYDGIFEFACFVRDITILEPKLAIGAN